MGTEKLSLELAEGMYLGGIALLQALRSKLDDVVIVTNGGNSLSWIPEEAHSYLQSGRCRIVICGEAALGMAQSLRTGIRAAEALGAEGALVMLADQPFVTTDLLNALVDAYCQEAGFDYIASGDEGIPKPPVVLGRKMWPDVFSLEGDAGARSLFRERKFLGKMMKVNDKLLFMDVDTPDLYEQAKTLYAQFDVN
jgi:molybdenum cofactor cytidylyltransferase